MSLSSIRPLHVQVPWISVLSPLSSYIPSVNDLVHPMDVDAIDSLTTPTLILTVQGLTLSSVYSFIQLPPWHLLFHVPRPVPCKIAEVESLFLLVSHVLTMKTPFPSSLFDFNKWVALTAQRRNMVVILIPFPPQPTSSPFAKPLYFYNIFKIYLHYSYPITCPVLDKPTVAASSGVSCLLFLLPSSSPNYGSRLLSEIKTGSVCSCCNFLPPCSTFKEIPDILQRCLFWLWTHLCVCISLSSYCLKAFAQAILLCLTGNLLPSILFI